MKCKYCNMPAVYNLYELKDDLTKEWVYVCSKHDNAVDLANARLRRKYKGKNFRVINPKITVDK